MFCTSASYLVARFHKVSVMHSRDTGPLHNLGQFGPILAIYNAKTIPVYRCSNVCIALLEFPDTKDSVITLNNLNNAMDAVNKSDLFQIDILWV